VCDLENLVNEEAIARVGLQRHIKKTIHCMASSKPMADRTNGNGCREDVYIVGGIHFVSVLDRTHVFFWNVPLAYLFAVKAAVFKREISVAAFLNWKAAPPPRR
jgi:hypothetical protein